MRSKRGKLLEEISRRTRCPQIKRFAGEFDPKPFHLDEVAAKATVFGGLAASGWHKAASSAMAAS